MLLIARVARDRPSLTLSMTIGTVVGSLGSAAAGRLNLLELPLSMHRRLAQVRAFLLVLVLASLAPVGHVLAQAPPQPLPISILTATRLTTEQKEQVKQYVAYWSRPFAAESATPEEIEHARKQLLKPLTDVGANVSSDFRFEYVDALIPNLTKGMKNSNLHTAVNAIIILSQLGHDKALTILLRENDKEIQPTWQLRLQSAYGCKTLLQSGLITRKADDAARGIKRAITIEDNPLVMRHQFAALNAADNNTTPPDERKAVRDMLVETLASVVDRIERGNNNPHPNPLLEAAGSAVPLLRTKFLEDLQQQPTEQAELGVKVGPILGRILSIAGSLWDTAQQDVKAKAFLSSLIGTVEGFLATIDGKIRSDGQSPKTRLREAWDSGNKDKFTNELNLWLEALKKAPYVR
jgi:hypothetical protein